MGFKSFSSIMMQLFSQDEEKYTVTSALKTIVKIDRNSMQYTVSYLYKYEWKHFCKVDIWHLECPDKGLHGL